MLVSLLRRVRGGSHLPQDAQPKRGGAGFAFRQLSRSRNPFQSHFPPKAKRPLSSLELFRVVLPFPAEEKTEYEQKRKRKKSQQ